MSRLRVSSAPSFIAFAGALLVGCGSQSHPPEYAASDEVAPAESPASVVAEEPVEAGDEEEEWEDEEEGAEFAVQLEDAAGAVPGTYELTDDYDFLLTLRLGARIVRAHLDGFDLNNLQSGNGMVFAIDVVEVPAGTLVVTHHNLDMVVDPPRFFGSRWSEGWWFPADMESLDVAVPVREALGEQYVHGTAQDDGSICISDAMGEVIRYEVSGRALVRSGSSDACEHLVAEQPEPVFERTGTRWATSDDYLAEHQARELGHGLFALQVAWSDSGRYEEDEDVPEHRSTRLVWRDERGDLHWYYLDTQAYCQARMSGGEIECGERHFRFEAGRLLLTAP